MTTAYSKSSAVFGRQHPPHSERYAMAEEFVEACRLLWDSWDDGAFIGDKQAGQFARPGSLHIPRFRGKFFSVEGALNVPRSPQGHPVLIQAGSSGPGQALAARIADVVFTAQNDPTEAVAFYRALKARVEGFGRRADEVLIMPGVMPVVGRTEPEAERCSPSSTELWTHSRLSRCCRSGSGWICRTTRWKGRYRRRHRPNISRAEPRC